MNALFSPATTCNWNRVHVPVRDPTENAFSPAAAWPIIGCPGCRMQMDIKKVISSGRGTKTGTVVYICEICEAEVERPYEGPCLAERPL